MKSDKGNAFGNVDAKDGDGGDLAEDREDLDAVSSCETLREEA